MDAFSMFCSPVTEQGVQCLMLVASAVEIIPPVSTVKECHTGRSYLTCAEYAEETELRVLIVLAVQMARPSMMTVASAMEIILLAMAAME